MKPKSKKIPPSYYATSVIDNAATHRTTVPCNWWKKRKRRDNKYIFWEENKDGSMTVYLEEQWYEKNVKADIIERNKKTPKTPTKLDRS